MMAGREQVISSNRRHSLFLPAAMWVIVVCFTFTAASSPKAQVAQSNEAERVHDLAIFFASNGWFSCIERADQIGSFLGGDVNGQVFVVNKPVSSSGLVSVTLLVPTEASARVGDIVFALGAKGCPATYMVSDTLEMSCQSRVESSKNTNFVELDKTGHFVAQINQNTLVRFSPSPKGCTRVQTEIVTGEE